MPATCFGDVIVHAVNKTLLFAAIGNSKTKPMYHRSYQQLQISVKTKQLCLLLFTVVIGYRGAELLTRTIADSFSR